MSLPYLLDHDTRTITLPGVHADTFDHETAVDLTEACLLMRGRTKLRVDERGRERLQLRHVAVVVARRWASRGWRIELYGEKYTLRLPTVRFVGKLLTMSAWVLAFERARARLSAQATLNRMRDGRPA